MGKINLETFCGGALAEQFNRVLQEITRNVHDPNTGAKKARKLNLTITFKPNEDRTLVKTEISAKASLVPADSIKTTVVMGKDIRTGAVEITEYDKQIKGQLTVDQEGRTFDPTTGEIVNQAVPASAAEPRIVRPLKAAAAE